MDSRMVTMNQRKLKKVLFEEFNISDEPVSTKKTKKENFIIDRFLKEFNMKHIDDIDSFVWNVKGNELIAFYKLKALLGELENA
ncbi:hypothetical protein [Cetobacterium somerae]